MTDLLIRLFIRDPENTRSEAVRTAYGNLAGLVGIVCNLLLCAGKFTAGLVFGSLAVTADAVNNLSDASSNVISLLGFRLGSRPADKEHPFGHARYEYLAGLGVAVMILLIGMELAKSSVSKILHPEPVEFGLLTLCVLVASILVKLWMSVFNARIGRKIQSSTLIATAADSRNDVISTAAVLAAGVLERFTGLPVDGWMGLAVAVFILYSGVGIIRDTLSPLLGEAPDEALVQHIHDKVMSYPGVLGVHDLMVHDYGPGRRFASMHVEMAAEGDVMESHDLIDNIERDFLESDHINVVIHFDPIVTSDEAVGDFRHWLVQQVAEINPALSIHDVRMVPGTTHTNVIFDCVVPPQFRMSEAQLRTAIRNRVTSQYPDYRCVITVEHGFAAIPHTAQA